MENRNPAKKPAKRCHKGFIHPSGGGSAPGVLRTGVQPSRGRAFGPSNPHPRIFLYDPLERPVYEREGS